MKLDVTVMKGNDVLVERNKLSIKEAQELKKKVALYKFPVEVYVSVHRSKDKHEDEKSYENRIRRILCDSPEHRYKQVQTNKFNKKIWSLINKRQKISLDASKKQSELYHNILEDWRVMFHSPDEKMA